MKNNSEELNNQETRFEKNKQRYLNRSRTVASKYLQKLEELPGAPEEFEYFADILRKVFINNETVSYGDNEKFVGSFCMAMPSELIRAAGARPLKLCSNNIAGFTIGDYLTPDAVCPLVKSVVGSVAGEIGKIYKACDMYIVPVTCDCKRNLANQLTEYKPTMPLYIPMNREDDEGISLYVQELKKAGGKISEITGIKVTRETLLEQILVYSDAQNTIKDFADLKGGDNIVIRGTHALAVMNSMAYDDIDNWKMHLKKLNAELLDRKNKQEYITRRNLPRILLAGSPVTFPNMKIPLIIEERGGIIVADETCLGDGCARDRVSIYEDSLDGYYRSLANRAVRPCSCSVFPDPEPGIHKLEKMVRDSNAEGIIYHVFRGCLTNDYEFEQIKSHFAKLGIPVIRIESDCSEEDVEQLCVRIEAFIEMIKFSNKKKERTYDV